MASRIDDAKIKITLDTSAAERQLEQMEAQIRRRTQSAQQGTTRGGPLAGRPTTTRRTSTIDEENFRAWLKKYQGELTAARQFKRNSSIGQYLENAEAEGSLLSRVGGQALSGNLIGAGRTVGAAAEEAGVPVKGLGITFLIYEGIKAFFQQGSTALQALKAFMPDAIAQSEVFKDMEKKVEEIAMGFTRWENQIKAIATGTRDAAQFARQGAILTGQIPAFGSYLGPQMDINAQNDNIKDKFERFKTQEVARAIGNYAAQQVFGASAYE